MIANKWFGLLTSIIDRISTRDCAVNKIDGGDDQSGTRSKTSRKVLAVLAIAVVLCGVMASGTASALTAGWGGIVRGGTVNDIQFYNADGQACASLQGAYIPYFGHTVQTLTDVRSYPETMDPSTGIVHPARACMFDTGDFVVILFGCDGTNRAAEGTCVPAGYPLTAEPVCKGNRGSPGQFPVAGDPCSLSTGVKFKAVTDYSSGGAYPIEIKRFYRSMLMPTSGKDDGMGGDWRIDVVGRQLEPHWSPISFNLRREDGTRARFYNTTYPNAPGVWQSMTIEEVQQNGNPYIWYDNTKDRFEQLVPGQVFRYTDENERADTFTLTGGLYLLTKTVWLGGYERDYAYDANGKPTGFTDSFGRNVIYTWTGNVITRIDLPDGISLHYTYEKLLDNGTEIPGTELLTHVERQRSDGTVIDSTTYQYDRTSATTPLLTGEFDAAGVQVDTTTYDSIGRVLTNARAGGVEAISIAYDDVANTRTVTDSLGQVTVYTVARQDYSFYGDPIPSLFNIMSIARQASATVPAATMQYEYDGNAYMSRRTDWNGKITTFVNDAKGNETQRVEDLNGVSRTVTTTWDATRRLPTEIVSPLLTVDFTYDTAGNLTQRKETDTSVAHSPPVRIWNYTYNAQGQLLTVTGPRTDLTQTTTYTYDTAGNLATTKNALNQITTITSVDSAGRPLSVQDPNGVVTNLSYDSVGRLLTTTVQGPTPATTTFAYDVNGLMTSITRPDNSSLTYGYDAAYRLTSITDSFGNKIAYTLDTVGNRLQTQTLSGSSQVLKTQSATFDTLSRMLTSVGAASQTTSYQYDNNGNQTRVTDPRNAVTQNAFDGLNRLKQVTDPLNGITQLALDGRDQITSVTDPRNAVTTYTVGGFGCVTTVASPDSGTTTYTCDLANNITSRKDARKITTTYTYDALDRPLTRTYPTTTENVTLVYDATANGNYGKGRLTSLTDAAGTASFKYDAYGNRISETRVLAGISYTTGYAYDLAGNVAQITYPSGLIVNYQRDAMGQVSGITMKPNATAPAVTLASNAQHMAFGALSGMTLGNGVQRTNTYDQDYRLSGTQAGTVQNLTLGYDGTSNISSITDGVSASFNQTFQYNLAGRLTNGTGVYGSDTYTYDLGGNRLTRTLVSGTTTATTYAITAATNLLASRTTGGTTLSYTYDANGNRTAVKQGNQTQASYTYNNDNRLATAAGETFKYDAFGRRAISTVTGGGGHFLFSPDGALMSEYTPAGVLLRNYLYLDGQLFAVADASANISYILNDQVGQPQKMLNASGTVTWHRVSGIFGDTVSQPVGSTSANPNRFPGQQYDATTGLHYNYFRDYDPVTGRYLESDPIGLRGGTNTYAYVGGNPLSYTDDTGEFANLIIGAATGVASGYALAKLTGDECYGLQDALLDAAMGAAGAGLASKLNKLARLSKLRNIADSRGLQNVAQKGYTEIWKDGANALEKLEIKLQGGTSPGLQAGSKVPRFSYRIDAGKFWDPFTGKTGPKGALSHVPLEPVSPAGAGAAGAVAGGAAEAATCGCER